MRVQDMQQFLTSFTEGSDAVKNAVIMVEKDGYLEEIKRMEVHEHSTPIVGHKGHSAHRLVLKTQNKKKLIIPPKLKDVY